MEEKRTELTGMVSRITYSNERNHYTVLRLDTSDGEVTAVGTFPAVGPGEQLLLTGEWRVHPQYGKQFHVHSHRQLAPATLQGLERYLSSHLIKGIGPALAKRLVARFGLDTLKVISETPELLAEVPGLGAQRRKSLTDAVAAHRAVQDIMVFLQGLGAGPALRLVRYKAKEWGIDPQRVGILGFSAGGHLAATAGTHFDAGSLSASDPVMRHSCRPDFLILCYPVITFGDQYAHLGSMRNLLGPEPSEEMRRHLSNEQQVTEATPSTFLWHTANDAGVPVENSLMFAAALSRHGVPWEMHIFPDGRHGLGLAAEHPQVRAWPELCATWLASR